MVVSFERLIVYGRWWRGNVGNGELRELSLVSDHRLSHHGGGAFFLIYELGSSGMAANECPLQFGSHDGVCVSE